MFVEVDVSLCFVNATQTVVVFSCVCTKPQSIHFERDKKLIYLKVVFTVLKKQIYLWLKYMSYFFLCVFAVERRRRDKINNWIVTLSKIIPDCSVDSRTGAVSAGPEISP